MKKHVNYIDYLRVFAIMAVTLIHCLPAEGAELSAGGEYFVQALHSCLNFAVPVFVMITGALMLDRDESVKKTMQRTLRLLVVLFIFGTAASWLEYFFNSREPLGALKSAVLSVFGGNSWSFTWFLYMLIGVYLTLPLFRLFATGAKDDVIKYILVVLFIMNSVIPCINGFSGKTVIDFYLPVNSVYALYLLLGYYIARRRSNPAPAAVCAAVIAVCAGLFALALFLRPTREFERMDYICGYASPITVVMVWAVFTLVKRLNTSPAIIRLIARNSFGIYLIHCFYIHIAEYILDMEKSLSVMPVMFIAVFSLSLVTSMALNKIQSALNIHLI